MGNLSNTEEFIKKSKKIHGDKYEYNNVIYKKSFIKVKINCKKHGEFLQTPGSHLLGCGCKKCYRDRIGKVFLSNKNIFVERANIIHNFLYDYSKFEYVKCNIKGIIICPIHGEFMQIPSSHLSGAGCKECGIIKLSKVHRFTTKKFIENAIKVHGNLFDYSKSEYKNAITKLEIICKIHGSFWQRPNDHTIAKQGCLKCSGRMKDTQESFLKKSIDKHGDKYDYSKSIFIYRTKHIIIGCSKHGDFKQAPKNHMRGDGCPKCFESVGEKFINIFLDENNIIYETQKVFDKCKSPLRFGRRLPFDFYLPEHNLIVEYDGEQHFEPVIFKTMKKEQSEINFKRCKTNDQIKNQYCIDNNIDLLRIPYTQIKNIPEILTTKLLLKQQPVFEYPGVVCK